jgi:hypothetical protein
VRFPPATRLPTGGRSFRLAGLRDFFHFARQQRICLTDSTIGLTHRPARGFRGRTLTRADQAKLLRRWTAGDCHPHEALVGLLALLHAASVSELRPLTINNLTTATRTVTLGRRPNPVPLDPLSFAALERCLDHRAGLGTENPQVIVTRGTRAHRTPALPLARTRPRWRHPEPAAPHPSGRAHPPLRPAAGRCRLRDDTRRSAALPDRHRRNRSGSVRERVSAAHDSSYLHSNLCALDGWMFDEIAIDRFS